MAKADTMGAIDDALEPYYVKREIRNAWIDHNVKKAIERVSRHLAEGKINMAEADDITTEIDRDKVSKQQNSERIFDLHLQSLQYVVGLRISKYDSVKGFESDSDSTLVHEIVEGLYDLRKLREDGESPRRRELLSAMNFIEPSDNRDYVLTSEGEKAYDKWSTLNDLLDQNYESLHVQRTKFDTRHKPHDITETLIYN